MAIDQVGNSAPVSQPADNNAQAASTGGTVDWAMVANAMLGTTATSEQTRAAVQSLSEDNKNAQENRKAEQLIAEDAKKTTERSTKAAVDQKTNEEKERVDVDRGGKRLQELSAGKTTKQGETPKAKPTQASADKGGATLLNPKSWASPFTAKSGASPQAGAQPQMPAAAQAKANIPIAAKTKPFVSNATQRTPLPTNIPLNGQPQKVAAKTAAANGHAEGEQAAEQAPEQLGCTLSTTPTVTSQAAKTFAKGGKGKEKLNGEAEASSDLSSNAPQASEEKSSEGTRASADSNLVEKKNKERLERRQDDDKITRVTREEGSAGQVEAQDDDREFWKDRRHQVEETDRGTSATAEAVKGAEPDFQDADAAKQTFDHEKVKLKRQIYAASINGNTEEIDSLMRDYAAANDQVKANRSLGGPPVSSTSRVNGKSAVGTTSEADDPSMGGIKNQLAQLNQNIERLVTGVVESNRMREEGTVDAIRDLKYAMTRTKPFNPVDQRPVSQTYVSNLYETRFQKTDPLRSAYQDVASGKGDSRQAASLNPIQEQADALDYKPDAIKKNKNPGRANLG